MDNTEMNISENFKGTEKDQQKYDDALHSFMNIEQLNADKFDAVDKANLEIMNIIHVLYKDIESIKQKIGISQEQAQQPQAMSQVMPEQQEAPQQDVVGDLAQQLLQKQSQMRE